MVFVALVAMCATFQGKVCAETFYVSNFSIEQSGVEIDDVTLEWIINQVVDQTGYSYSEIRNQYDSGTLSIQKVPNGYEVTLLAQADGGEVLIILEDL